MSKYGFCGFLFSLLMLCFSVSTYAQPQLQFPLACTLGEDCFIINYVDTDLDDGAKDYRCGPRTYNDHKGTDIALRDRVSMEMGVDVRAAAGGTVLRVRDEIEDKQPTDKEMETMLAANKGCGNGVLIDHGNGWQTIYCHLKQGSVTVAARQKIKAGTKIAQVGQSGAAEFPHLHLGVFFEGHVLDPFSGVDETRGCLAPKEALWKREIEYQKLDIYAAGFKNSVPDFEALKIDASSPDELSLSSDVLVFWAGLFGVQDGDQIHMEIRDPAGNIFASRDMTQSQTRARQFYYVGRKAGAESLMSGNYTGHLIVMRLKKEGPPLVWETEKSVAMR